MIRRSAILLALALAACGGGQPVPRTASVATTTGAPSSTLVDPAALYCARVGGTVTPRIINGRRADICRLPDGRSVAALDLMNSHNDL